MTIYKLVILTLTFIFFGCVNNKKDDNHTQIKPTKANDFKIKVLSPDTIGQEKPVLISIVLDNSKYKVKQALYAYSVSDSTIVDTTHYTIQGFNGYVLPIDNDTIKLSGQTTKQTGEIVFQDIVIFAVDKMNNLYYDVCKVKYFVK